jgi:hypothetical protein
MAKKQTVAVIGRVITVSYPTIKKSVSLDLDKCSAEMVEQLTIHGGKQKLGDAKSGGTPQEKFDMASRIIAGIYDDQWELTSTPDMSGIVIEAVATLKGLTYEKVEKAVESNPDKVKEWASNPKVKAQIAQIRADRAQKLADEAEEDEDLDIEV